MTKRYFVRASTGADLKNIQDFYHDHEHKNVLARDPQLVRTLVENGNVCLIEDVAGVIVGASISYPLKTDPASLGHDFMEVGSTRITLNGYPGVFDALIGFQILRACFVDPPEQRVLCKVDAPPVQAIIQTFGYRSYSPTPAVLAAKSVMIGKQAQDINWFSLGVEALPVAARNIVKCMDQPITSIKGTEPVQIDFSRSKFVQIFEKDMRILATRDLGKVDSPDYKIGLADVRRKWMRSL